MNYTTFVLDIWHAGWPWRFKIKFESQGQSLWSQEENIARVVGATSNEGLLVYLSHKNSGTFSINFPEKREAGRPRKLLACYIAIMEIY